MGDLCKGCISYYYNNYTKDYYCAHGIKPTFLYNLTIEFCLCTTCIVKAMCSEACEKWREYIRLDASLKKRKVINVIKRSL